MDAIAEFTLLSRKWYFIDAIALIYLVFVDLSTA